LLERLEDAGILMEASRTNHDDARYVPGRDPCSITASHVIEAVCGLRPPRSAQGGAGRGPDDIAWLMAAFVEALEHSKAGTPLKDIPIGEAASLDGAGSA